MPLAGRPEWRALEEERDPGRLLAGFVRLNGEICDRVGPVFAVVREAARVEPALEDLQSRAYAARCEDQRRIAVRLAELGALRPGLDVETAADIVWALGDPALRLRLVGDRGWSPAAFEAWVLAMLEAALLA